MTASAPVRLGDFAGAFAAAAGWVSVGVEDLSRLWRRTDPRKVLPAASLGRCRDCMRADIARMFQPFRVDSYFFGHQLLCHRVPVAASLTSIISPSGL